MSVFKTGFKDGIISVLTDSDAEGRVILPVHLGASVVYNNTTTMADTLLRVDVEGGCQYTIQLWIDATSATKGLNLDFAGTSVDSNFSGQWTAYDSASPGTIAGARVSARGTDFGPAGMDAVAGYYIFDGLADIATGGTFLVRGAANALHASNTAMLRWSRMILTKTVEQI